MRDLGYKLMSLHQRQNTANNQPTAIFGSTAKLSQSLQIAPLFRIGVWPCISSTEPESAMGLMTILALLLDRWRDVRVYRLFSRYDPIQPSGSWSIEQSQFSVADWLLDDLDENVVISGKLEVVEQNWDFSIEIENDLANDDQNTVMQYQATTLAAIYAQLPAIAEEIVEELGLVGKAYKLAVDPSVSEVNLRSLLRRLFHWQINLQHTLLGQEWPEKDIEDAFDQLIAAAQAVGDEFSAWVVASMASHTMQPGYQDVLDIMAYLTGRLTEEINSYASVISVISLAHYRIGEPQTSYTLLEDFTERISNSPLAWRTLAELYRRGSRHSEALDTFQQAIEIDAIDSDLYVRYADLVLSLDYDGFDFETFVLCDPDDDDYGDDIAIWEAIEAYEEALTLEPNNPVVLQQQVLRLIEADAEDPRLWQQLEKLLQVDDTGELVRLVIDAFDVVEDISPAIQLLEEKSKQGNEISSLINLASAYMLALESEKALQTLEKARALTEDTKVIQEIDRLTLEADDPEFEARMAEYVQVIDAGKALKNSDVEYLEDILDRMPSLTEIWVILAQAYLAWNDNESALETLMDGYTQAPRTSELVTLLGEILWNSGQRELAISYMSKGIEEDPFHLPLLARLGLYLFEENRRDEAREYLNRAEDLAPRHPELSKSRSRIANILANETNK